MNKRSALVLALVIAAVAVAVFVAANPVSDFELAGQAPYSCAGGKTIMAFFYKSTKMPPVPEPGVPPTPTGRVKLDLGDGRTLTLFQTISADGSRYANADEAFVFWSKGFGAFIMENGTTTFADCLETFPTSSFSNAAGGYGFAVPSIWNAKVSEYAPKNSLFGTDASSAAGIGGVEVFPKEGSVKAFLAGVAAKYSNEKAVTVGGAPGIEASYDGGAAGRGESVTVLMNGTIYNIYIGSTQSDDLGYFKNLVDSFRLVK